ncbi:hypothetical protein HMPREF9141_1704 [Prevotella multiformis DSM 16608]|uniref:Uncharacterized protein n=1 Tax=Prevotella multiformis DSM 16608 TaxID=888743 RepID=F0F7Y7_9BACT|nr:hypothetical protein HMPREF9141_1704 [Prevotella multiformis DSM 16608]
MIRRQMVCFSVERKSDGCHSMKKKKAACRNTRPSPTLFTRRKRC